jgi:hypothetical protein
VKKIESLTPEQEARFAEFRDKWIAIGTSTEPADHARAEAAVAAAFIEAKQEPPKRLYWSSSPLALALTVGVLRSMKDANVRANVLDNVRANVLDNVSDNVLDNVSDNVRANVSDNVRDNVRDNVLANVSDLWAWGRWDDFGQWACYWLSYYDYMESLGVEHCKRLHPLAELAHTSGWNVLFAEVGFMGERPTELHRDEQGRLHSETGMAIQYPDGWGFYSIHGVGVPEWVVMRPDLITVEKIDAEENAEIRRVLIERMGPGEYLFKTAAKVIDDDVSHGLPRALLCDKYGNRYLYGSDNSTGRIYTMPVDPESKTCRQAHQSICGFDESLITAQS